MGDFATKRRHKERIRYRDVREINTLCIHHSASKGGSIELFRKEHKARGWADIGYHAVIGNGVGMPDGHIGEGRPAEQVGAAVYGANTGKLHVCVVGNFHKDDAGYTGKPTKQQMYSLGYWLCISEQRYGKPSHPLSIGVHKDVALKTHPTACPGSEFPTELIYKWWHDFGCHYASGREVPNLAGFLDDHGYWDTQNLP
jgi:hypothetical protein